MARYGSTRRVPQGDKSTAELSGEIAPPQKQSESRERNRMVAWINHHGFPTQSFVMARSAITRNQVAHRFGAPETPALTEFHLAMVKTRDGSQLQVQILPE